MNKPCQRAQQKGDNKVVGMIVYNKVYEQGYNLLHPFTFHRHLFYYLNRCRDVACPIFRTVLVRIHFHTAIPTPPYKNNYNNVIMPVLSSIIISLDC